jgi:hypothetical protein
MRMSAIAVGLASLSGFACSAFSPEPCPEPLVAALRLDIRDSLSDKPAAYGTRVIVIRLGVVVDSAPSYFASGPANEQVTLTAAHGLTGQFDVLVQKAGYRDWMRTGIVVRGDRCGSPITVSLSVKLQRTST